MSRVIVGTTLTCPDADPRHGEVNTSIEVRPGTVFAIASLRPDHYEAATSACAVVCTGGGTNGHMQSICRAAGIPVVLVGEDDFNRLRGRVAVDPATGEVCLDPPPLAARVPTTNAFADPSHGVCAVAARTDDVYRVNRSAAAEAVDSFFIREEFLWTSIGKSPLEVLERGQRGLAEYGHAVASSLAKMTAGLLPHQRLVYRLLDLRSDDARDLARKKGPISETNPDMGVHGARWIRRTPIYHDAVHRILDIVSHETLTLAIPFVNDADEFCEVLSRLDLNADQPIAVFVETPSAVFAAADFCAAGADEIFVGTKDLTQFILAADRGNHEVSDSYQTRHPAVLDAIRRVAESAEAADVPANVFMLSKDADFLRQHLPTSIRLMACVAEILASWKAAAR